MEGGCGSSRRAITIEAALCCGSFVELAAAAAMKKTARPPDVFLVVVDVELAVELAVALAVVAAAAVDTIEAAAYAVTAAVELVVRISFAAPYTAGSDPLVFLH